MQKNIFQKAYAKDLKKAYKNFRGIIFDNVISDIKDLQTYFSDVRKNIDKNSKILISYHNHTWEPILTFASRIGLRRNVGIQNWLTPDDVANILNLSGFEVVSTTKRFFGISMITVARSTELREASNKYSVSIIIPARNEEGNISKIIPSIPKFGKSQEIIFIEGHSKDHTWEQIKSLEQKYKNVRSLKQTGKGKADAVKLGFSKAKGDILMIYDADMTVDAQDLLKFYNALDVGAGEFANGSRLVYPMEQLAMQTLNKLGNHFFGKIFSGIFGQTFKDTLCGTKVLFRSDFLRFRKDYEKYLKTDPFGDFALIFTAIKNSMKVVEIPVRYRARTYGETNISRFKHGLMLFKMVYIAFKEFKI